MLSLFLVQTNQEQRNAKRTSHLSNFDISISNMYNVYICFFWLQPFKLHPRQNTVPPPEDLKIKNWIRNEYIFEPSNSNKNNKNSNKTTISILCVVFIACIAMKFHCYMHSKKETVRAATGAYFSARSVSLLLSFCNRYCC